MRKVLKSFFMVTVAMVISLGFVSCSDDDDNQVSVNLEGKWLMLSDSYKELLIINADYTFQSIGADTNRAWSDVRGRVELEGDCFTFTSENGEKSLGTYSLADKQLTLNIGGEVFAYNKMIEEFSLIGSWKSVKTQAFIQAVKDVLNLPFGSIVNGEEIPISVKTANIKGEFINEAVQAYFRNVEFNKNGKMYYNVVKEGVETPMIKNYVLTNNLLQITGEVGSVKIDNEFMAFQSPDQTESYLFLTKEAIAEMFVGYSLLLRNGGISEGSMEALDDFREEFLETFKNFAVIVYLQKQN